MKTKQKPDLNTRVIAIDAETATRFLSHERPAQIGERGTNRKAGLGAIREYAAAMLRGEWVLTHQGIAFNEQGELVDGGHRMRAVILAAETDPTIEVPMLVSFNVPPTAMGAMDIGKRRVPADFLSMEGEDHASYLGGIIRMGYCYEYVPWDHSESWKRFRMTPKMQLNYLEENPGLRDAAAQTFQLKRLFKPSASGGFLYLVSKLRPDVNVDQFVKDLRDGENLKRGQSVLTLRELMLNSKASLRQFQAAEEMALLIKAFNRWLTGEPSQILAFRVTDRYPRIFTEQQQEERVEFLLS